jgi:hypothetical protein
MRFTQKRRGKLETVQQQQTSSISLTGITDHKEFNLHIESILSSRHILKFYGNKLLRERW